MLREQIETEEDVFMQQNDKISDNDRHETMLRASSNEHVPKWIEENYEGNNNAFDDDWIKPKKCASTTTFVMKSKNKEEHDDEINKSNIVKDVNNNQCEVLLSENEKEDENECYAMACEEGSSVVMANEETHEQQVMIWKVNVKHQTKKKKMKKMLKKNVLLKHCVKFWFLK